MPSIVATIVLVWSVPLTAIADSVASQETTPTGDSFTLESSMCTVQPRPFEEIQAVVTSPVPETSLTALATTAALIGNDDTEFIPPAGEPVDIETTAAVTATIRTFYACLATENDLAAVSVATADFLRSQRIVSSRSESGEDAGMPATPAPDTVPGSTLTIGDIQRLADDRIGAIVEIVVPSGSRRTDYLLLRDQDGQYLIDAMRENIESPATPAP